MLVVITCPHIATLQYKAMLISLAVHLLLLMFELLAADNLDTRRHKWILVFIPLVVVRWALVGGDTAHNTHL